MLRLLNNKYKEEIKGMDLKKKIKNDYEKQHSPKEDGISPGQIVVTQIDNADNDFPFRFIFSIVLDVYNDAKMGQKKQCLFYIIKTCKSVLEKAEKLGSEKKIKRILFPSVGWGALQTPIVKWAQSMSQGFSNALVEDKPKNKTIDDFENIGKVSIVIFNQKEFSDFKMYWENPEPPKHDEFDSEEEMNKTILQHNKSKQTKRQKKNGPSDDQSGQGSMIKDDKGKSTKKKNKGKSAKKNKRVDSDSEEEKVKHKSKTKLKKHKNSGSSDFKSNRKNRNSSGEYRSNK